MYGAYSFESLLKMSAICQEGLDKIKRQNIFAQPLRPYLSDWTTHARENLLSVIVGRKM